MKEKEIKEYCGLICKQTNVKNISFDGGVFVDGVSLIFKYNLKKNKFYTLLEGEKTKTQLSQEVVGEIVYNFIKNGSIK